MRAPVPGAAPEDDASAGWNPDEMPDVCYSYYRSLGFPMPVVGAGSLAVPHPAVGLRSTSELRMAEDEPGPLSSSSAIAGAGTDRATGVRAAGAAGKPVGPAVFDAAGAAAMEELSLRERGIVPSSGAYPGAFAASAHYDWGSARDKGYRTYFGVSVVPEGAPGGAPAGMHRRIDLKCFNHVELPAALVQWTGNIELNRSVRIYARQLGYVLDERGLVPVEAEKTATSSGGTTGRDSGREAARGRLRGETADDAAAAAGGAGHGAGAAVARSSGGSLEPPRVPIRSEVDLFSFLGLRYIRPYERNCFAKPVATGSAAAAGESAGGAALSAQWCGATVAAAPGPGAEMQSEAHSAPAMQSEAHSAPAEPAGGGMASKDSAALSGPAVALGSKHRPPRMHRVAAAPPGTQPRQPAGAGGARSAAAGGRSSGGQ